MWLFHPRGQAGGDIGWTCHQNASFADQAFQVGRIVTEPSGCFSKSSEFPNLCYYLRSLRLLAAILSDPNPRSSISFRLAWKSPLEFKVLVC